MTVNADATYTVTAKHSSFNVTYPDNSTTNATHGTDFVIDMAKATADAVVTAVKYQVGDGEAVTTLLEALLTGLTAEGAPIYITEEE